MQAAQNFDQPSDFPGPIIAEFVDGSDALAFMRSKGERFTVTAGIHLNFAVRKLIPLGRVANVGEVAA